MPRARLAQLLENVRISGVHPDRLPTVTGPVAIWGAGTQGKSVADALRSRGAEVTVVVDSHPMRQGDSFCGIEIIPPYLLCRHNPIPVFVCVKHAYIAIMQLRQMGFEDYFFVSNDLECPSYPMLDHAEDILRVYAMLADQNSRNDYLATIRMRQTGSNAYCSIAPYHQYNHPHVKPKPGAYIINGGGYIGNTADGFTWQTNRNCHIWSFEPSSLLIDEMAKNIRLRGEESLVTPVHMGLWSEVAELHLAAEDPLQGNCSIQTNGDELVQATSVDAFMAQQGIPRVDLIELDVEGSEPEALRGAEVTLRRWRPRLLISLYHTHQHLWELPLQIEEIAPGYAMYIGHHTNGLNETILYCTT